MNGNTTGLSSAVDDLLLRQTTFFQMTCRLHHIQLFACDPHNSPPLVFLHQKAQTPNIAMRRCGDKDEEDDPNHTLSQKLNPETPDLSAETTDMTTIATISPMNSNFYALTCKDTLSLIFSHLLLPDLARASCVSRLWRSVGSEEEMVKSAFMSPWKLKEVIGKPVSGSFWRENGIVKFAVSHKISRGDSVASLAVKYSVQVMDIKRLNNMMSDHGIYSRERLLIPISNPDLLVNGTCYIELDTHAKREVAVLYLEGEPHRSCLANMVTSDRGKRRVVECKEKHAS